MADAVSADNRGGSYLLVNRQVQVSHFNKVSVVVLDVDAVEIAVVENVAEIAVVEVIAVAEDVAVVLPEAVRTKRKLGFR